MTTPFNLAGSSLSWASAAGVVTLVEGASFCIGTPSGDIHAREAGGLFYRDTRLISRWELHVDGQNIEPLSVQPTDPFAGVFVGRPHPVPGTPEGTLVVVRKRIVGHGMCEVVQLRNLSPETTAVTVSVTVEADFADLFSVKEGRAGAPGHVNVETAGHLAMWPENGSDGVLVRSEGDDAVVGRNSLSFRAVIPPHGEWHRCLEVVPVAPGESLPPQRPECLGPLESSTPARRLEAWRGATARLCTNYQPLGTALERTQADLGSLRIVDPARPELTAVAAGAPWYMTLFGRDSLLTSWSALVVDPTMAVGSLYMLADLQGDHVDPATEEEPGRILHEMRHGCGFGSQLTGDSVYYGTADATPLFVMLLGELYRWGHGEKVRALVDNADRALAWIEEYGDRDGDGFVEYKRATDHGLLNQGWKDSWDGVSFDDGRLPEYPVALAEVQAYVYGAYRARAVIARAEHDEQTAARYEEKAAKLKRAFTEAFWLPERGYYAFALDGHKRPVDALASNLGHCLWTGIVDEEKAPSVAAHLISPQMFTGWGIRTLSSSAARYNPVSYHNGSVWPHDTAIAVAGLVRYGFTDHARKVAIGLLDTAAAYDGRLPELFCGFDREDFSVPVSYPSSCSPQAWAAAAPLLIVRALLGLEPDMPQGELHVAPTLTPNMGELRIDRLALGSAHISLRACRDRVDVEGLADSLRLVHHGSHTGNGQGGQHGGNSTGASASWEAFEI